MSTKPDHFIHRHLTDNELSSVLKKNGVHFTEEEIEGIDSINITYAKHYQYVKDGQPRHCYELCMVMPPDDYVLIQLFFSKEATIEEIVTESNRK